MTTTTVETTTTTTTTDDSAHTLYLCEMCSEDAEIQTEMGNVWLLNEVLGKPEGVTYTAVTIVGDFDYLPDTCCMACADYDCRADEPEHFVAPHRVTATRTATTTRKVRAN